MNRCSDLNEVRENINRLDEKIVKLIAERSEYVRQAAAFKKNIESVKASDRVEIIINKVRKLSQEYNLNPDLTESIYRNMINEFVNMELKEHKKYEKEI